MWSYRDEGSYILEFSCSLRVGCSQCPLFAEVYDRLWEHENESYAPPIPQEVLCSQKSPIVLHVPTVLYFQGPICTMWNVSEIICSQGPIFPSSTMCSPVPKPPGSHVPEVLCFRALWLVLVWSDKNTIGGLISNVSTESGKLGPWDHKWGFWYHT